MTDKPTHTPTPWKKLGRDIAIDLTYDKSVTASFAEVATTAVGHWTTEQADANAAFICRAVNAHEELLDALKTVLNAYCAERSKLPAGSILQSDAQLAVRYKRMAREAIAKAEGK